MPNDHPEAAAAVTPAELSALRDAAEGSLADYLRDLETLVSIDSGSYTKAGVDAVGRWVSAFLTRLGARIAVEPNTDLGDTIVASVPAGDGDRPKEADRAARLRLLVIGHLDTVFDPGTAAARPMRIEDSTIYGPGTADMKAGLLAGLYAVRLVESVAGGLPFDLVFVANPDEEIGSPASTPIIRREAERSDVCLVLECGRANGDIVSARKGMVDLRLTVHGRSAHAGVEPEKGRSAIVEAANQIQGLAAIHRRWPDVTCNVGVVRGGTRPNVVAEDCVLEIDLRAETREHLEAAEAAVRDVAAATAVADTTVEVEEMNRHWPMEKGTDGARLVDHAVSLAAALGFSLADASTGGASDANTTAGMGVPSLDGLGPVGGNDHSPREYVDLDSVAPRMALLAGLMLAVSRDPSLRRSGAAG